MGEADKQRRKAAKAAAKKAEEADGNDKAKPAKRPGGMAWRRGTGKQVVVTGRGKPQNEQCRKKKAHPAHMHSMNGTRYYCSGVA